MRPPEAALGRTRPPDAEVRAMSAANGALRGVARQHAFGPTTSEAVTRPEAAPTPIESLLYALAGELLAGLRRSAFRAGERIEDAELVLSAWIEHPLVALGVIGETGSPALARVEGSLYVSGPEDDATLARLWAETVARSTLHATLARAADVHVTLKPVS